MFRDLLKRSLIYLMPLAVYLLLAIPDSLAQELRQTFEKLPIGRKDGLRLTTEIYKQHYKADDEMIIRVKFENLTEKNMYISKHQYSNVGSFVLYSFTLKGSIAFVPRRDLDPLVKRPTKPQLSLYDFALIVPGGSYAINITIRLSNYVFLPGEYDFNVNHESRWYQKEVPELEGVWGREHGFLFSEITVKGAPISTPSRIVITSNN